MKITLKLLKELNSCEHGIKYFTDNNLENTDVFKLINKLIIDKKYRFCNELICKVFSRKNLLDYLYFSINESLSYCDNLIIKKEIERGLAAIGNCLKIDGLNHRKNARLTIYSVDSAFSHVKCECVYMMWIGFALKSALSAAAAVEDSEAEAYNVALEISFASADFMLETDANRDFDNSFLAGDEQFKKILLRGMAILKQQEVTNET